MGRKEFDHQAVLPLSQRRIDFLPLRKSREFQCRRLFTTIFHCSRLHSPVHDFIFTGQNPCTRIIKLDTRRAYKPLISNEDQSVRGTIKLDTLGRTWPCRPTRPDNRVGYSYPDYGMPDPGGRSIRVGRMVKLASFHQSPSRPQQACRTNHKCFSCCWLQSNPAHN